MNAPRAGTSLLVAAALIVAAGCAARSTPSIVAEQVRADALAREGCYDCLLDARAGYERLPASQATIVKLIEVNFLLALREKELALDPVASIDRATQLMARLPRPPEASAVLGLITSVPEDSAGRRVLSPALSGPDALNAAVARIDASPFSSLFKSYLKLSVQCGRVAVGVPAIAAGESEAPLLTYRLAICENPIRVPPLRAVREAIPRAVETSVFLGRAAMATIGRTDGREARALFEEAFARFPDSPSIAFNLATVYQAGNGCRRAQATRKRVSGARSAARTSRKPMRRSPMPPS